MCAKIVATDTNGKDIFEQGLTSIGGSFLQVLSVDGKGESLVKPGSGNHWVSDPSSSNPGCSFYFPSHSVTLQNYALVTSKEKKGIPQGWALFGYDGTKWDYIAERKPGKELKHDTIYTFDINPENHNTKYNYIRLCSLTGQFALSGVRLFGSVWDGALNMPKEVLTRGGIPEMAPASPVAIEAQFDAKTQTKGVLEHAFQVYGPSLARFQHIYASHNPGCTGDDLLKLTGKPWVSGGSSKFPGFTLYFPDHAVQLTKYVIENPEKGPLVKKWAVLGITEENTDGEIIEIRSDEQKHGKISLIPVPQSAQGKKFRGLRFLSMSGQFSVAFFDFFGTAVPDKPNPIPEEKITAYTIPIEISNAK